MRHTQKNRVRGVVQCKACDLMASPGATQASHMLDKQPNKPATLLQRQTVMSGDCLFVLRVCVRVHEGWRKLVAALLTASKSCVGECETPTAKAERNSCYLFACSRQADAASQRLVFSFLCFFPYSAFVFSCVSEDRNYTGCCYLLKVDLKKNALALPYEILGGTSYEVGLG